ncbi:hypothetical protein BO82DRAFT_108568 [Aspergillus uvarum CBS 121591]|uniref:Uncharacterized protein n=1 Tax=Aspergillus uvarum CBS 121591 TaxID=1448315 RepID=A0A319DMD2_9EURO|nr:hypothetical protein BO82DRAFT_108568 [Aspergillus uvarum CBS 121591]PYH80562.1 hypothetical protein BO82DRAFT_108568 [Aspergillus uvarum CBS 121591]
MPLGWTRHCQGIQHRPGHQGAAILLCISYLSVLEVSSINSCKSAHSVLVDRKTWRVCRWHAHALISGKSGSTGSTSRQWRNGCGDHIEGNEPAELFKASRWSTGVRCMSTSSTAALRSRTVSTGDSGLLKTHRAMTRIQ